MVCAKTNFLLLGGSDGVGLLIYVIVVFILFSKGFRNNFGIDHNKIVRSVLLYLIKQSAFPIIC